MINRLSHLELHGGSLALKVGTEVPTCAWGMAVCVAGSTFTALGLVMQKYSHTQNLLAKEQQVYYRQPVWLSGLVVFLVAQIVNLLAMSMAPQVMLSTLGAWSLICNALFVWVLLGEHIQPLELVAMLGIIIGVVSVVAGTPASTKAAYAAGDVDALVHTFMSLDFILFCIGIVALVCVFVVLYKAYPLLEPPFWSLMSALASGFTTMFFKCVSLILVEPLPGAVSPLLRYELYIIIIFAVGFGVAQIHTLNIGLQVGDALTVIPIYYALGVLAQIMTGAVFFGELDAIAGAEQAGIFWGGVLLLVASIVWMTRLHISDEMAVTDDEDTRKGEEEPVSPEMTPEKPSTPTGLEFPAVRRRQSSLDYEMFPDSFGEDAMTGRKRVYTVSVTGPMGIA